MRILKTKVFGRFQRKESIDDRRLIDAIERAARGLIDADLGHGLIKQRIARAGGGKSGGWRTIIAYRCDDRAIFLYGFAKSARANISADDLVDLAEAGAAVMALSDRDIDIALDNGALIEVRDGDER